METGSFQQNRRSVGIVRAIVSDIQRNADFAIFIAIVLALSYLSFTTLPKYITDVENRDWLFLASIPVACEVAHWITRFVRVLLLSQQNKDCTAGLLARSGIDSWLYLGPACVGCAAFLVNSPAPLSRLGIAITAALLAYQFIRSRVSILRYLEIIELPISAYLIYQSFALMVLRSTKDEHHWAFFIGPAQAAIEGGQLLWNSPSQYGFLMTMTIAKLSLWLGIDPIDTFGGLVVAAEGIALLLMILVMRFGLGYSTLCATVVAIALKLCLPCWIETYSGPAFAPNSSAMRFLPSAIALVAFYCSIKERNALVKVLAAIVIAAACLWSPESCLYTGAPIAASVLLSLLRSPSLKTIKEVGLDTAVMSVVLIVIFLLAYSQTLPHGIDLYAFYEYAAAYSGYTGTLPIERDSWTLLFVFIIGAIYFVARSQFTQGGAARSHGVLAITYVLCIGTYFVARSNYRNVHNIAPWALLVFFMVKAKNWDGARRVQQAIPMVLGGFTLIMFLSFDNQPNRNKMWERQNLAPSYVGPAFKPIQVGVVESARRAANSDLFTLIDDRALFARSSELPKLGNALPINPFPHFSQLPPQRIRTYLRRMLDAVPESYVLCSVRVCPSIPYTFRDMTDIVEVTDIPFEFSEHWQILRLRRK